MFIMSLWKNPLLVDIFKFLSLKMCYRMKIVSDKVTLMFYMCVCAHAHTHSSRGITFQRYSSTRLRCVEATERPCASIINDLPHSFLNTMLCTLFFYIPLLSGW